MKKALKNVKGITLVALIITIIILLILSGITIGQFQGNGLFENAKTAKEEYQNSAIEENTILSNYETEIGKYVSGTSRNPETSNSSNSPILIERVLSSSTIDITDDWGTLESISLSGYGSGKAMISVSMGSSSSSTNLLNLQVATLDSSTNENPISMTNKDKTICYDCSQTNDATQWHAVSASGFFNYDENTVVGIFSQSHTTLKPTYEYQILLFPD